MLVVAVVVADLVLMNHQVELVVVVMVVVMIKQVHQEQITLVGVVVLVNHVGAVLVHQVEQVVQVLL